MKKIQINIFAFLIILVVFCSISAYAGTVISGTSITYDDTNSGGSSTNVQDAIDDLYDKASYGDATSNDILTDKTALLNGEKVTGTMVNNGAWTSLPTASGKVTIPEGYHDGTGYVDTSSVYAAGVAAATYKTADFTLTVGSGTSTSVSKSFSSSTY